MKRKDSTCVEILSDQGKLKLFQTSVNILYIMAYCLSEYEHLGASCFSILSLVFRVSKAALRINLLL